MHRSSIRPYFLTLGGLLIVGPLLNDLLAVPPRFDPGLFQIASIVIGILLIGFGSLTRLHPPEGWVQGALERFSAILDRLRLGAVGRSAIVHFAILLALQIKLFREVGDFWDVPQADGGWYYYFAAVTARTLSLPNADWSPLYTTFYALFHLILAPAGALVIYTVHRVAVLVILNTLLYVFLRRLVSPLLALVLTAWGMLLGNALFNPFIVHHFAVILLLLAYLAALSETRWREGLILLALIGASLVRPEYRVSVGLYAGWLAFRALRDGAAGSRSALIVVAAAALMLPSLLPASGVGRAELAFGQHIAWTYHEQHPEWDGYYWLEWQEIWAQLFGTAGTVGQAALANPGAVANHIAWNVRLLPGSALDALEPASRVFAILGLGLVLLALSELSLHRETVGRMWRRHRELWIAMLCGAAGTMIACLLIRPRTTYLVAVAPMVFLGIGMLLDATIRRIGATDLALHFVPLAGAALLIGMPSLFVGERSKPADEIVRQVTPYAPTDETYALIATMPTDLCAYLEGCIPFDYAFQDDLGDVDALIEAHNIRIIALRPDPMLWGTDEMIALREALEDYARSHEWMYLETEYFEVYVDP